MTATRSTDYISAGHVGGTESKEDILAHAGNTEQPIGTTFGRTEDSIRNTK
jgi:hypothetical protein